MSTRPRDRQVTFTVQDDHLVRQVRFPDGSGYEHRCTEANYATVAHAMAETPAQGVGETLELIAVAENLPYTQVNVALEFLKERGLVEVRHRRCYPASSEVYLDAMIEFYALKEEGGKVGH